MKTHAFNEVPYHSGPLIRTVFHGTKSSPSPFLNGVIEANLFGQQFQQCDAMAAENSWAPDFLHGDKRRRLQSKFPR